MSNPPRYHLSPQQMSQMQINQQMRTTPIAQAYLSQGAPGNPMPQRMMQPSQFGVAGYHGQQGRPPIPRQPGARPGMQYAGVPFQPTQQPPQTQSGVQRAHTSQHQQQSHQYDQKRLADGSQMPFPAPGSRARPKKVLFTLDPSDGASQTPSSPANPPASSTNVAEPLAPAPAQKPSQEEKQTDKTSSPTETQPATQGELNKQGQEPTQTLLFTVEGAQKQQSEESAASKVEDTPMVPTTPAAQEPAGASAAATEEKPIAPTQEVPAKPDEKQPEPLEREQEQEPAQTEVQPEEEPEEEESELEEEEEQQEQEPPEPIAFTEPYSMKFMLDMRVKPDCRAQPQNPNKALRGLLKGTTDPLNKHGAAKNVPPPPRPRTGAASSLTAVNRRNPRNARGGRGARPGRGRGAAAQGPGLIHIEIPETQVALKRSENAFKRGEQGTLGNLRGSLGKITLDNFDEITLDIISEAEKLLADEEGFREFVDLIHDTARDSEFFSMIYAKVCKELCKARNTHGKLCFPDFKQMILDKCQEDVDQDFKTLDKKIKQYEKEMKKLQEENITTKELTKTGDELYTLNRKRQKLIGNSVFIAELYNVGVIDHNLLKQTTEAYWKQNEAEDAVMCVCKVVEKSGKKLEDKNRPFLEDFITRLSNCKHIPNKLKFYVMDIKDLRKKGWKRSDDGPRKRDEVLAEAEAEMRAAKSRPLGSRRTSSSQPPRHTTERVDRSKIGFMRSGPVELKRASGSRGAGRKFGTRPPSTIAEKPAAVPSSARPSNRYMAPNQDVGRETSEPEKPTVAAPARDEAQLKRSSRNTIEEYILNKDEKELFTCVRELGDGNTDMFVSELAAELFTKPKKEDRDVRLNILDRLLKEKLIDSAAVFTAATEKLKNLDEEAMDAPKAPDFLAEFVVTGLSKERVVELLKNKEVLGGLMMSKLDFVLGVLAALKDKRGEAPAKEVFASIGGDLSAFERRPNPSILQRKVDRKGLNFLLSPTVSSPQGVAAWAKDNSSPDSNAIESIAGAIVSAVHNNKKYDQAAASFVEPLKGVVPKSEHDALLRGAVSSAKNLDLPDGLLPAVFEAFKNTLGVPADSLKQWNDNN